ncbi:MAG: competence/damage-inducible protein A [SAR324 cluster bacterium]|nr:competence/damage-inducible protein A [SAR324 cluster bacterium]
MNIKPAIITVGDEILWGDQVNDNQAWLIQLFRKQQIPAQLTMTLPDSVEIIAHWMNLLLNQEYFPIFVSGGIGGTHDDCTRDGIAKGAGVALTVHEECFEILRQRYGDRFNESRQRMAHLPHGCELLPNPLGAPGFIIKGIYAFPGFPQMLKLMTTFALEHCLKQFQPSIWAMEEVSMMMSEGEIAHVVEKFSKQWPEIRLGIYPHPADAEWRVTLRLRYPLNETQIKTEFEQLIIQLCEVHKSPVRRLSVV